MTRGTAKGTAGGIVPALAAYLIWGLSPIFWKWLASVAPDRIIALRILWSFVLVMLVLAFSRGLGKLRDALRDPRERWLLVVAAVLIAINWLTYIVAVNGGMLVAGSLGYYINPLVSFALGILVFRERLRPAQIAAIALAVAGVAVETAEAGQLPWISLVLAFSFGFYGLIKKKAAVDPAVGLAVETGTLLPFALAFLWFAPTDGLLGGPSNASSALAVHGPLLDFLLVPMTGVVTAVPLLLFAAGAKKLDLTMAGFLQYVAPTFMLALGVFAYGESFRVANAISFGLIWAGIALYMGSGVLAARRAALQKAVEAQETEEPIP